MKKIKIKILESLEFCKDLVNILQNIRQAKNANRYNLQLIYELRSDLEEELTKIPKLNEAKLYELELLPNKRIKNLFNSMIEYRVTGKAERRKDDQK